MWSPLEGYTTVRFCFVQKGETFLSLCHHRRLLGLCQGVEPGQSDWCAALSSHMQPCWRPGERIFKTVKWYRWTWWERKWNYLKIRYRNAKGDFPWVMCPKGSVARLGWPGEHPSQDCGVESKKEVSAHCWWHRLQLCHWSFKSSKAPFASWGGPHLCSHTMPTF